MSLIFTNGTYNIKTKTFKAATPPAEKVKINRDFNNGLFDKETILRNYFYKYLSIEDTNRLFKHIANILTDSTNRKLIYFYGTGNNGKSTLMNILEKVLGKYYMRTTYKLYQLVDNTGTMSSELAYIYSKQPKLVVVTEPEPNIKLDSTKLAQFAGSDTILARTFYRDPVPLGIGAAFLLSGNTMPENIDNIYDVYTFSNRFVNEPSETEHRRINYALLDAEISGEQFQNTVLQMILDTVEPRTQRIFGIVGAIGSGKDTIGDRLIQNYGFQKTSFAKRVKDVAAAVFGWDREMLEGSTKVSREWREVTDEYWGITPRLALQKIGTEMFRNQIDDAIWVKAVKKEVNEKRDIDYVITDCRFKNEVEAIKEMGGTIVYVDRHDKPEWYDKALAAFADPESPEAKWLADNNIHKTDWNIYGLVSLADIVVENKGTLEELYQKVDTLMC